MATKTDEEKKAEDKAEAEKKAAEEKEAAEKKAAAKKDADKAKITEKLPPKLMAALEKVGYKLEQVMATRSYSEQKLYRVVTTDGQRHEISFEGKYLGETPAERKSRVAAEAKKKAKGKK